MNQQFDVAVIGAGAAGMMAAAVAGQRGKKVILIDHAERLAEKIRISGGGRCNFTNLGAAPNNYLSQNPHFCKSALSRYTPQDFLALLQRYGVRWHEKHKGQLFCDDSAEQIIDLLKRECDAAKVSWRMGCAVSEVSRTESGDFELTTGRGLIRASALVIATGGLSIPKIGATDFSHRIARQFGLKVTDTRPALVPLTFLAQSWEPFVALAGLSLEVDIETGDKKNRMAFREDMLFTHRGLSGPAILQISSYWQPGTPIRVNLLPEVALAEELIAAKKTSKKNLANLLAQYLPTRLADGLLAAYQIDAQLKPADMQDKVLRQLAERIQRWELVPDGTEGYRKAEVTVGGVDTRQLEQQTMMVKTVPGLYFVGEAIDVTGWLGGYNFQWAWASGFVAGQSV